MARPSPFAWRQTRGTFAWTTSPSRVSTSQTPPWALLLSSLALNDGLETITGRSCVLKSLHEEVAMRLKLTSHAVGRDKG